MAYELRNYSSTAAATTLTGGITNSSTALTVNDATGWPTSNFYATIDRELATEERVFVTSRSGNTLTVVRGADGTLAVAHGAAPIEHTAALADFAESNAHVTDDTRDDHSQYLHLTNARTMTAAVTSTASSSNFGAGGAGGAGAYVRIGDRGDVASGYVVAEGATGDIGLVLRSKGNFNILLQPGAGSGTGWVEIGNGDLALDAGILRFASGNGRISGTVGAAGAASAPPAFPVNYLQIKVDGTTYKMPYYHV